MSSECSAVRRVCVHKLFGEYDYDLEPSPDATDPSRLLILYGDNGSGKTTILKTLFHILAPEGNKGHRNAVKAVPFGRFEVELTSGHHVWAQRPEGQILGGFTMGVRHGENKETTAEFCFPGERGRRREPSKHDLEQQALIAELSKLGIGLYFLADDRTVRLSGQEGQGLPLIHSEVEDEEVEEIITYRDAPSVRRVVKRAMDVDERSQRLLADSIERAAMWIRFKAMRGAAAGESSVNALYGEILDRIARSPLAAGDAASSTAKAMVARVAGLEGRSRDFAKYGLLPEFDGKEIASVVENADGMHLPAIVEVLGPYIESMEKRLDAMAVLQSQIDGLVGTVNTFLNRKTLTFDLQLREEFGLRTDAQAKLTPSMLSSGERQLLLLFCNALIAYDRPSIFIVDEPEISLNIKWQRHLLSSLLQCAEGNPVQYVLATHSLELLAQHMGNTIKLQ